MIRDSGLLVKGKNTIKIWKAEFVFMCTLCLRYWKLLYGYRRRLSGEAVLAVTALDEVLTCGRLNGRNLATFEMVSLVWVLGGVDLCIYLSLGLGKTLTIIVLVGTINAATLCRYGTRFLAVYVAWLSSNFKYLNVTDYSSTFTIILLTQNLVTLSIEFSRQIHYHDFY